MPYADLERRRQMQRERQQRRRSVGICVSCNTAALPGLTRCAQHREDHKRRNALRYIKGEVR